MDEPSIFPDYVNINIITRVDFASQIVIWQIYFEICLPHWQTRYFLFREPWLWYGLGKIERQIEDMCLDISR